jgi:predicted AlkP superfamily phosphohydrolase/phosphomutase
MLRRVRELMPNSLHRAIWRRLPSRIREARQHALGSTTYDFEKDRLFTLVHEIHPAIRFNLRGREAMGFLPPEDADGILDALEEFTVQFTAEDGEQAFTGMWRAKRDQPGPMSHHLPDAMILTNQKIKATHKLTGPGGVVITSNRQEARNGTHNGRGFCYFRPAGSQAATRTEIDVRDFAPSILELLEVSHDREFDGRSFLS